LALPFLRDGTLPQAILQRGAGVRPLAAEPHLTWSLAWPPGQSWHGWYDGLSGSYRRAQRKKRAILPRSGATSFDVLDNGEECAAIIDMMLDRKRHWARRAKLDNAGHWLREQAYAGFLKTLRRQRPRHAAPVRQRSPAGRAGRRGPGDRHRAHWYRLDHQ